MKQTGMLDVSLRVFRTKCQYLKPPRPRLGFREETQNYAKRNRSQIFFSTCFVYRTRGQNLLKPRPDWSPLGVTKSLSHAQMVFPTSIPVCSIWESPPGVAVGEVSHQGISCIHG